MFSSYFQISRGISTGIHVTELRSELQVCDHTTIEVRTAGFLRKFSGLLPIRLIGKKPVVMEIEKLQDLREMPAAWYDKNALAIYACNALFAEMISRDETFLAILPSNPHLE